MTSSERRPEARVSAIGAEDLTGLTAWGEGVSEPAAHAPDRIDALLAEARVGATSRAALELPEPSPRLADAVESRVVRAAAAPSGARYSTEC